jgi:hypothetical protein
VNLAGRSLVTNARTGDTFYVAPGELVPVDGDPRDLVFGVGRLIPVTGMKSYPCAVLDTMGDEVDWGLAWEWPPPYDGEQRRAAVRGRNPVFAWVQDHLKTDTPLELYPWQQRFYDMAMSGEPMVMYKGRRR